MRSTSTTVVVLMAAMLLLASSCQGRRLTQAIATANSVAGPGESVSSYSGATSEQGKLTVSNVNAKGSGPGTTVDCAQEAKSGQVKSKECGGGASSSGGSGWDKAPACKKAAKEYTISRDGQGKPWGFDAPVSCALR